MKTFNIYANPQKQYKAVKIGWSWPGFFFCIVWALIKQMWAVAGILFAVFFVIGMLTAGMPEDVSNGLLNILSLGASLLVGFQGNNWVRANLLSRGYELIDTVTATNKEAAIALFLRSSSPVAVAA